MIEPVSGSRRRLPGGIWALGMASLCMDTSSELIHSVLPVFMATTLGASLLTIGLVEGLAEATAAITKVFSGTVSDLLRRRKVLLVLGYGLAAATKPVFPLATSVGWVFGARFVDRIGKGIRGAPRDALVADITPPELRGAAYGLRQALDSVGAVLGPLLALVLLELLNADLRSAMWFAVLPAVVTILVLLVGVHDPSSHGENTGDRSSPRLADVRRLPGRYWLVVLLGAAFTLARFSQAFLVLRGQDVGLPLAAAPLVMVAMNLVYAGGAYPAGVLADRVRARTLLQIGLGFLMGADLLLALVASPAGILIGASLWGLHLAATQGLLSKLVADVAPAEMRGSAFGIFNLVTGLSLLLASVIAGALWTTLGPAATFLAGAGFAAVALIGLCAGTGGSNRPIPQGEA